MTFPRSRNGWTDDGSLLRASNRRDECPNCGSSRYRETVSLEICEDCGLRFDYWGGGGNDVYRAYEEAERAAERRAEFEREQDLRSQWEEEWAAQSRGWDDDD